MHAPDAPTRSGRRRRRATEERARAGRGRETAKIQVLRDGRVGISEGGGRAWQSRRYGEMAHLPHACGRVVRRSLLESDVAMTRVRRKIGM